MAKSGTVALIGRPNAGKSTLLNRLLAEKLAIVSDKPQTTRHRIVGILTTSEGQMVFFDTPGVHRPLHKLNKRMLEEAHAALAEADVVVLLRDVAERFGRGDAFLLELVSRARQPKIAVLNKIDLVAKPKLLPEMARYAAGDRFAAIVPVSAATGDGTEELLAELWRLLPEGEPRYDRELLTIHPERFLVAERIREKMLAETRDELPFTSAVLVESWEDPGPGRALRIGALLLVDRDSHKGMLIGKRGERIKSIGTAARLDLEDFLERKVHLDLRVRVEPGWRENPRLLADLERDLHVPLALAGDENADGGR
jgi:GTPase